MTGQAGEVQGMDHELRGARRNVYLLTAAQAILGTIGPIVFSVGGVAGYQLLGDDKSLATAPLTGFNVGVALGAVFVAAMSRLLGRKQAFMVGAFLGAGGGIIAAYALFKSDFWLFALGMCVSGVAGGFTQKLRFAAADASPGFTSQGRFPGFSPAAWCRPCSARNWLSSPRMRWHRCSLPVPSSRLFRLVLRPLLSWRSCGCRTCVPPSGAAATGPVRPLREIVLESAVSHRHGLRHIHLRADDLHDDRCADCHGRRLRFLAGPGDARHPVACAGHVCPEFLYRHAGQPLRGGEGGCLRAGHADAVRAGRACRHCAVEFLGALILLGAGWNFGFIGSTAIVASSYRPQEADKVQGFHDIILFTAVALASFGSGKVLTAYGWDMLSAAVWPVTAFCLLLLISLFVAERRRTV